MFYRCSILTQRLGFDAAAILIAIWGTSFRTRGRYLALLFHWLV